MKKSAKIFVSFLFVVGLMLMSGTFTSCKSNDTMNRTPKYKTSKPIKHNYKIRGTNKKNGSTYHSY